jgi:hypothetical protein
VQCPGGQVLCGQQCVLGNCCPGLPCGAMCSCVVTVDGDAFCRRNPEGAIECADCSGTECPAGQRCIPCGGDSTCAVACDA